jgi:hypothetical protein
MSSSGNPLGLGDSNQRPFRFRDPQQERIYRRLLLVGPGPAAFYQDACQIMATGDQLQSITHLVSHLIREIESSLRDVLDPLMERPEQSSKKGKTENTHEIEIRAVLKGLGIPETDPVALAWLELALRKGQRGLHVRAHRDALARPRPVDGEYRQFWENMQHVLDAILERFESRYLELHAQLDELLAITNPQESDADKLRGQVPNNRVAFGYFFGKLTTAAWLGPLRAAGFFKNPPDPERDLETGSIHFPIWPESQFLARIAPLAPQTVLEIALEVPATMNPHVHDDLADVAIALPAALAVPLVPKAKEWIEAPYHWLLPKKLGDLIEHLAKGGQESAALELAHALLTILPDPKAAASGGATSVIGLEPHFPYDQWDYEQILKKNIPPLVAMAGVSAFSFLCDLLESAVRFSQRPGDDKGSEDYSYIWRPTIEVSNPNSSYGIKDLLVSAVHGAAEQIAIQEPKQVATLVDALERRQYKVFHRIALHLLRKSANANVPLVAERLTKRELFENVGTHREYMLLAKDCFGRLSPTEQQIILDWVSEGPDLDRYKRRREEFTGEPVSDEYAAKYADHWRLERLAPLRGSLLSEWEQRVEGLIGEFGEPEDPGFVASSGEAWVGPTSPDDFATVTTRGVDEVVQYLRTWIPTGQVMSPSPEGLGRELQGVVASNPSRFASSAMQFQELDPTYVRSLLAGLREAAKQERSFPWESVLELCQWIVQQPRNVTIQAGGLMDRDPDWGWARKEIADLLSSGLEAKTAAIPFNLREAVWQALEPLTQDVNPSPEHEAQYGPPNMDAATLSLNTVRGEAMHTVVVYALWVRRSLLKQPDGEELIKKGFAVIPEVQAVLDYHLDTEKEPSLAVRSVYGKWLPQLTLLHKDWVRQQLPRIFPEDANLRKFRDAAWESYIIFQRPYDEVFEILQQEYARAIEYIGTNQTPRGHLGAPDEHLAQHLMILYWRKLVSLDDAADMLARFYIKASVNLRAHAIEYIGHILHNTKGEIEREALDLLRDFFIRRIEAVRNAGGGAEAQELIPFGWWFASRKFDDSWALLQLKEVLALSGWVEADNLVVEQLAALAGIAPLVAVECLSLLSDGDKKGWGMIGWRESVRPLLSQAIRSANETARQAAISFIHRLGARGHLEFADLLSNKS